MFTENILFRGADMPIAGKGIGGMVVETTIAGSYLAENLALSPRRRSGRSEGGWAKGDAGKNIG